MDELKASLKEALGTVFAFYIKVHGFHWNVEGPSFYEFHKMFEDIYTDVYNSIDPLAEQLRALSSYAPASLKRYIALSKIPDTPDVPSLPEMLTGLIKDNQMVVTVLTSTLELAQKHNQQGLMNFLADRIDSHNKWGWFLRASNKKGN